MEGWICLHRKIIEWEWYTDIPVRILFEHLLLTANHDNNNWRGVEIKRGQKITSIKHLSDETGLTEQQVRTAIKKLKSTGEITSKTTNKYSLITVVKYSDYQDKDKDSNKQNNKQDSKQITINQQTNNKQITTNNNDNNVTMKTMKQDSIQSAIEFYQQNITFMTPFEFEKLQDYKDMNEDLIILAMQKAILSNKRNFNYIDGILKNWKAKGIKTVIQAKQEEQEFKNKKQPKEETEEEAIQRKLAELRGGAFN